ncbi:hypothetical protein AAG570_010772 [Ranatra chinensis]|uniref:Heparan sulfate 2-O-sulfotransferase pipe n=1 Tax=Ranatra chinensis TaxID=642074 RepID=A0ABD0YNS1_9HEMI
MGKRQMQNYLALTMAGFLAFVLLASIKLDTTRRDRGVGHAAAAARAGTTAKTVTKSLNEANCVTPTLAGSVLFFNRVPKTGSEMLVLLVQWLQTANGFRHVRLPGGNLRRLNRAKQADLVDEVMRRLQQEALPLSFDRHVYFINFTSHGQQSPTYLNLVRDPIQKLISSRAIPNPNNPDMKLAPKVQRRNQLIRDIEYCFSIKDPECTFENGQFYDLTIPYFCGHNKWCMMLNDEWALMQAKYNVEKYYPVVGVLEEMNATLSVLENKIPLFFRGIKEMYFSQLSEPHFNKNKNRPANVSSGLQKQLEDKLKLEYEFYYWLKKRLLRQYAVYKNNAS